MDGVPYIGTPRAYLRRQHKIVQGRLLRVTQEEGFTLVAEYRPPIEACMLAAEKLLERASGDLQKVETLIRNAFMLVDALVVRLNVRKLRLANRKQCSIFFEQEHCNKPERDFFMSLPERFDHAEHLLDTGRTIEAQLVVDRYFDEKIRLGLCLMSDKAS